MRHLWRAGGRLVSYAAHLRLRNTPLFHARRQELALPLRLLPRFEWEMSNSRVLKLDLAREEFLVSRHVLDCVQGVEAVTDH